MKLLLIFVAFLAVQAVYGIDYEKALRDDQELINRALEAVYGNDYEKALRDDDELINRIIKFVEETINKAIQFLKEQKPKLIQEVHKVIDVVKGNLEGGINAILSRIQQFYKYAIDNNYDVNSCLEGVYQNIETLKQNGLKNIAYCDSSTVDKVGKLIDKILDEVQGISTDCIGLIKEYRGCTNFFCKSKWGVKAGIKMGSYSLRIPKLITQTTADGTQLIAECTACAGGFVADSLAKVGTIGKSTTDCISAIMGH